MDSDNPTLRWSLAAVGVVVVCFCLGYFVFGPKGNADPAAAVATPSPAPTPASLPVTMVNNQPLQVEDITAEKEAERKRKEAEEKAKLEAKAKAAEEALLAATPEPTPDAEVTDDKAKPADDETTKPADEKSATPDEKSKSADEKPVTPDEKTKPAEEKAKPADEKAKPAEEKSKPADEKPKPKTEAEKEVAAKGLFRVRIGGTKTTREDAEKLVAQLRGQGYTPAIIADQRKGKTVFHVQAGAFSDSESAERRKRELENNGYDVRIN